MSELTIKEISDLHLLEERGLGYMPNKMGSIVVLLKELAACREALKRLAYLYEADCGLPEVDKPEWLKQALRPTEE